MQQKAFSSMTAALADRWQATPQVRRLDLHGLIKTIESVEAKRQALTEKGTLTERGIKEAMVGHAATELAPAIAKATRALKKVKDGIAAERAAMRPGRPDPHDAAGAILRMDIRRHLQGLELGEQMELVQSGGIWLQAVAEVPPEFFDYDETFMARIEEDLVIASDPERHAQHQAAAESVMAFEGVLGAAQRALHDAIGSARPDDVKAFMKANTPSDVELENQIARDITAAEEAAGDGPKSEPWSLTLAAE